MQILLRLSGFTLKCSIQGDVDDVLVYRTPPEYSNMTFLAETLKLEGSHPRQLLDACLS